MSHPIEILKTSENIDLMFQLVSLFKSNHDLKKIATALDCAFALGAIRHESAFRTATGRLRDDELVALVQSKFDKLGIKVTITPANLARHGNS